MTTDTNLRCGFDTPRLSDSDIAQALQQDLPGWQFDSDESALLRRWQTKGFAKAVYLSNLAVFLADQSGHHPDMRLGWGYFEIRFTTHDAGGVTAVDVNCAKRFDEILSKS